MPLGSKLTLPRGHNFTLNYLRKTANDSLEPLMGIWPNSTGIVPGWSPTKLVEMLLIGCISRSRGKKINVQNAVFKNHLVRNYKAHGFHIWYIASSTGPLPKLFQLWPWEQNCTAPSVTSVHWIIPGKVQTTSSHELLMGIRPKWTGMVHGWSLRNLFKWFWLVA